MPSYRDVILPPLDITRGIGGLLGLRVFQVTVRVRTYDVGGMAHQSFTDVDTILTNPLPGGGTTNVRVRQLSRNEIIASGGVYTDRDLRVGPMTPPYPAGILPAGGVDDTVMNVAQPIGVDRQQEIFWRVTGLPSQGYPGGGSWCDLKGQEFTALHAYLILRTNGKVP